jgi:hypothetical protein
MANRTISGVSSAPTEDDSRKRTIVAELIQSENKAVIDFAKQLVTTSFSAIGIVLALKDKWLGANALLWQKSLLGCAVALFLVASLLATMAAAAYRHHVSLSDYTDVDAELHRVARLRYRLTVSAFGFLLLATLIIAIIVICA